jgi:hypothetical protein
MLNFIILYFCNLVLDYPLQGTFLAECKQKNNYILFVHCAIWALGISIVLLPLGLFAWWKVIMLLVGHYIIDYWKCRGLYKRWPYKLIIEYTEVDNSTFAKKVKAPVISDCNSLYIDQLLHVIQILLCLVN